ncbi:hypothetical protein [Phenylobacterium sp.]|jgi:hypothetical protein|uniref:hypothetical protein n=1 Tax=Phenylobacterium sp. TaxID=1871053 RepID=UPI002F3E464E
MSILPKILKSGLLAGALVAGAASAAHAETATRPAASCFQSTAWRGWSSPSPNVLYLKVNMRDVYRVDLAGRGSSSLKWPGYFLVSQFRGSNSICSPVDLDIAVADAHGYYQPLFPRAITRMTPEEIAAIPRKYRP